MITYFSAIVLLICLLMIMIIVYLTENETLSVRKKDNLRYIAELILFGVIFDFLGKFLNYSQDIPRYVHGMTKAIEYSISPIIATMFIRLLIPKSKRKMYEKIAIILIVFHTFVEILSIFKPIVFFINEKNVHVHGNYYFIYVIMYFMYIILCILEFIRYCKRHQSNNIFTISAITIFVIIGLAIHIINSGVYTDWLVVSIMYVMFILTYSDLYLKVDALTGLLNRRTFDNRINSIDYSTAVIIFDVNEFKAINDNYNHQCGDVILKVIADDILEVYGKYGYCYRIGGDEFCVMLKRGMLQELTEDNDFQMIEKINEKFDNIIDFETGKYPMISAGVSKGVAIYLSNHDHEDINNNDHCSNSIKEIIKLADERMYHQKNERKTKNSGVRK